MSTDEAIACWAALVAYVQDIHQPQDNLTEAQWKAAERLVNALPTMTGSVEDDILGNALWTMLGEIDPPDMPEDRWTVAERMLTEYTARVEA